MTTYEEVEAARSDPKLANVLYHDWEADTYDEKWSISFDKRCIDYARDRFVLAAGADDWPYPTALEVGSGTGFFLLNLMQAGVAKKGVVTDMSLRATPNVWGWTWKAAWPMPKRFRTRTIRLTSLSGTPSCTTYPTYRRRSVRSYEC